MRKNEDGSILLTIGEMTKLSRSTKDTLYYYERIGLLKPKYVDPDTGYRFYDADNFMLMDMIQTLREAECPVKDVKEWMEKPTPSDHVRILLRNIDHIRKRISELQMLEQRISGSIDLTNAGLSAEKGMISVLRMPKEYLVCKYTADENDPEKYLPTFFEVQMECSRLGIPHDFHPSAMVSQDRLQSGNYDADYFYLRSTVPVEGEYIHVKPEGDYLMTVHYGPYREIAGSIKLLMEEAERKKLTPCGAVYEQTLIGWMNSSNESEYRTGIYLPVCKKKAGSS